MPGRVVHPWEAGGLFQMDRVRRLSSWAGLIVYLVGNGGVPDSMDSGEYLDSYAGN